MSDETCKGCGRNLSDTGTHREAAGRRYSARHGWHNATAKACSWCGTWVRWDADIPSTSEELVKYANDHGMHFFDTKTMRFFGSRLHDGVTVQDGRAYFITSERDSYAEYPHNQRGYTVRYMVAGGFIREVGGFQQHASLRDARKALAAHLRGDDV